MKLSRNWMIGNDIFKTGNWELPLVQLQYGNCYVTVAGEVFVSWASLWIEES